MRFRTIVLSLETSIIRREKIKQQLNKIGLEFVFFNAFNGKDVPVDFLDHSLTNSLIGRKLTPAEVGCAYSHYQILKKISKEKKIPYLILEDDVILFDNFLNAVKDIVNSNFIKKNLIILPDGYDFFPRYKSKKHIFNTTIYKNTSKTWGTYAMIIHPKIACELLTYYMDKIFLPADFYGRMFTIKPINIYGVIPPVLYHPNEFLDPSNSIIGKERSKVMPKVLFKKIIRLIFVMKNKIFQYL